ncbi:hypothetical protein GCG54_00006551 [Colletotrichum gloeosporioides]|uniref:F-box domain-containing protein n=1 Tax=Colletotrichum gloeosporioides TaxID=474922 RepID=A0A8H4FNE8_COLGL|nr:uncharacterized protein GCG54_00006551 [Colletotrichum gloeosporioides]KAF3808683.1 hypothetical protein GCG54_00006551 [Colletotrichum gloeosporioides]
MFHHYISSVMMGNLSGGPEAFGKETEARLPLLFTKVMEAPPAASQSLLFRLPPEILGDIMDLIADDKPSLASLALVNSDCRQLARPSQFAMVTFDYSPASHQLAKLLSSEAVSKGPQSRGRIGPCIRRVKVASDPIWVVGFHKELYDSIWEADRGEMTDAKREYVGSLKKQAELEHMAHYQMPILTGIGAMPNLEAISWLDGMCQSPDLFMILAGSSVQHIKFYGTVSEGLLERLDQLPAHSFQQVRCLDLKFNLCRECQPKAEEVTITDCDMDTAKAPDDREIFPERKPESDCDVIAALIKRCEQSLETLIVRRMSPMDKTEERLSLSSQDITLRSLRTLDLSDCVEVDLAASRVMLCPSLRHLSMPWKWDESFLSGETLRNLETLVIPFLKETPRTVAPLMKFLNRHPHIKKLCLGLGTDAFIDNRLLPCLSNGNWANLNSLSLTWDGPGMEESTRPHIARVSGPALAAIGSLDSLEQLSLTAGVTSGWSRQWLIDHDAVRESLKGLTRLKRLAISRDTYPAPFDAVEPEYYYAIKVTEPEDFTLAKKRNWMNELKPIDGLDSEMVDEKDAIWEYAHRYKMFKQAEKYAEVIPTLEWVFCGEWPMDFFDGPVYEDGLWDGQTTRKVARPLARARDSCRSYLRQTFGMGHEED